MVRHKGIGSLPHDYQLSAFSLGSCSLSCGKEIFLTLEVGAAEMPFQCLSPNAVWLISHSEAGEFQYTQLVLPVHLLNCSTVNSSFQNIFCMPGAK